MSIVKYTNKTTGAVTWYESTSHYDPETKQSRPVRKYLGREDPVTGELIPSSGKRGRKKSDGSAPDSSLGTSSRDDPLTAIKERYESRISSLEALVKEQQSAIRQLEAEKTSVIRKLSALLDEINI